MGVWLNGKAPDCKSVVVHTRWFDSICSHVFFHDSTMAVRSAVNRRVVGSTPTRGAMGMKTYIVPIMYRGLAHFKVEASSEEEAKEKAEQAFVDGQEEVMLGNETEEVISIENPEIME